jgi:transposase
VVAREICCFLDKITGTIHFHHSFSFSHHMAKKLKLVFSCRHLMPPAIRAVVKWLHKDHNFNQNCLAKAFNVSRTTIMRCIKNITKLHGHRGGRKPLTAAQIKSRKKKIQKVFERRGSHGKRLHPSARAVANVLKLENPAEPWSKATVVRVIQKSGGRYVKMPRVPWMKDNQRLERFDFAKEFFDDQRPKIFVDEAYITVNSSCRTGIYWWPAEKDYEAAPEDFNRNDQFPTKLFVFGAVGHNFKHLTIIRLDAKKKGEDDDEGKAKARMGAKMYIKRCLAGPVMRQLIATNSVLVQDNASSHTAGRTVDYLAEKGVTVMGERLPPKSCDLNIPIERTWSRLKRLVQADACDTVEDLVVSVKKHWDALSQEAINKMVSNEAWKKRCLDVVEAGGWYTWGKRADKGVPAENQPLASPEGLAAKK